MHVYALYPQMVNQVYELSLTKFILQLIEGGNGEVSKHMYHDILPHSDQLPFFECLENSLSSPTFFSVCS